MLWQPSPQRISESELYRFMQAISKNLDNPITNYQQLHEFSVKHSETFWAYLIDYFELVVEGNKEPINTDRGFSRYGWFPQLTLNYAQNLMKTREADKTVLVSLRENGDRQAFTAKELQQQVAHFQQAIKPYIEADDVLACFMPNIAETAVAMLATTALGGVFTSTSCDFGIEGVTDRFGQSKPKVLVACAAYQYNGKTHDCLPKIQQIVDNIPTIEKVFIVDFVGEKTDISHIANAQWWDCRSTPSSELSVTYVMRKFSDPLYIMYSSGTTGKPKCIVHSVGGVLLQHVKELGLHSDFSATKNMMFFTTCGWMMWNWQISALFFGGTVTLYEGSPAYPSIQQFVSLIDAEKLSHFGTSPKFLKALEDQCLENPTLLESINLDSLQVILSTGSPLLPEQYDFVYGKIKQDVLLASISGGTDIIGCFFLGNPILPVYRGELQCKGLGMDVACLNEAGEEVVGQEGELVCKQSFPSRPIYFLGDEDGHKIHEAYFNHYPDLWYHGDFIQLTAHGGAIFFGRSDATLNPGGVRIGTSEIYRQTETLSYIEDSVCVGKQADGDVDVVLFVKLKLGEVLSDERVSEIKALIKSNTTPRHVPKYIRAVNDIPYTRSGKKIELAVSRLVNGKAITNQEAIANPESLSQYESIL
ncbi:Acetyl-coenzyme A synthetase [Thalassocella blandensis]|nr:Acetyl-coenzyme A synthetase [Thalassocella blandensis]